MAPKKNDIVALTITDIGENGEGIGRAEGFTLFVKGAVVGDVIEARVLKAKKTYGYAKIERLVTPSADRVEPVCPVAGRCGGCQLTSMSYPAQLRYKQSRVKSCLERIGGITFAAEESEKNDLNHAPANCVNTAKNPEFLPILGMDDPLAYRNKAQFPVGTDRTGAVVTGFYAGHSHDIIPCDTCAIQAPVNEEICRIVRKHMEEFHIPPYREDNNTGLVRHILTRVGAATGEVLVCLVVNGKSLPGADLLAKRLKTAVEAFSKRTADTLLDRTTEKTGKTGTEGKTRLTLKGVCLNVNCEKTNVILGPTVLPVWGDTYLTDYIGEIAYRISPLSFYQVNPAQTKVLYHKALEFAGLTGNEIVWDLYCGIGTISLFLAAKAKQVYGVEIVPQAIEDAKENALRNGITNAEFFVGAAEDVLPAQYRESGGSMRADVIVVDPPRKGCDEALLQTIVKMEPERVVYVSCDPATLARDVRYLEGNGYRLVKAQPVDMFPGTVHVETVVLLSKGMVDKDNYRKVKVDFSLEDMDLTELRGKATYAQVKEYILNEFGLKVSSLYIAQVKKKCGLEVGENHNLPNSEDAKQPQVTPEKEDAIMKAFRHFGVI